MYVCWRLYRSTRLKTCLQQDDKVCRWTSVECIHPASAWVTVALNGTFELQKSITAEGSQKYVWQTTTWEPERVAQRSLNLGFLISRRHCLAKRGIHLFTPPTPHPPTLMSKLNTKTPPFGKEKDGTRAKEVLAPAAKVSYTNMVSSHREHHTHHQTLKPRSNLYRHFWKTPFSQSSAI